MTVLDLDRPPGVNESAPITHCMPDRSEPSREIVNFGGNIRFRPARYYEPRNEHDVLEVLRRHARGRVRVAAALHSWSGLVVSDDAVVSMRHWTGIEYHEDGSGRVRATVGGGWQIKHLLRELQRRDLTLPAIGLITEQTLAGAIATGTHGSGNHSLGHYIQAVRLAAYDGLTGEPRIYDITGGPELLAARCHLGCLGIVLSVTFECRPEYHVGERNARYGSIQDVLASEQQYPLQHFFLVPHHTALVVQHRAPAPPLRNWLYRLDAWSYLTGWFLTMDVGLHVVLKSLASVIRSRALTRAFFRHVMPYALLEHRTFIGRSDLMLTFRHELFRHFELELFVPQEHVAAAAAFFAEVLKVCDGAAREPAAEQAALAESIGMLEELRAQHGVYTHHYPVCVRRILRDESLLSMASGNEPAWYSFSFITLQQPQDGFRQMADFLAAAATRLFRARLHWGKYFPLGSEHTRAAYPRLPEFVDICRRFDPHGVFQNDFTRRVLSMDPPEAESGSCRVIESTSVVPAGCDSGAADRRGTSAASSQRNGDA
jgi:FAD/FMN-containing dehydrogenase